MIFRRHRYRKYWLFGFLVYGFVLYEVGFDVRGFFTARSNSIKIRTSDETITTFPRQHLPNFHERSNSQTGTYKWVVHAPPNGIRSQNQGLIEYLPQYTNPCWYEVRLKKSTLSCLPYVYVLGTAKSGTTTLCTCLDYHPQVEPPYTKELSHWRTDSDKPNVEEYTPKLAMVTRKIQQQKSRKDEKLFHEIVTYDGTPSYIWHLPHLPNIIQKINPRQKMIISMRNPTDRLFSHYHHVCTRLEREFTPEGFHAHVTKEISLITECYKNRSISDCVVDIATDEISIGLSVYYVYAKAWLDVFPSDQILFIKAEEFYVNTSLVMEEVFHFLELAEPGDEVKQLIESQSKDYVPPALELWVRKEMPGVLRDFAVVKDKGVIQEARMNWTSYRQSMLPETRQQLDKFYTPFNRMLADLLGDARFLFART